VRVPGLDRAVKVVGAEPSTPPHPYSHYPHRSPNARESTTSTSSGVIDSAASSPNTTTQPDQRERSFRHLQRRGHYELGSATDPKHRLTTAFTELTLAI